MRRFLLIFLTVLSAAVISAAQESLPAQAPADDTSAAGLTTYYMELRGNVQPTNGAIVVTFNIGTSLTARIGIEPSTLKLAARDMRFGSMADAMNFLAPLGWKFESAYTVTNRNNTVIFWVVSKAVSTPMQLLEGFI